MEEEKPIRGLLKPSLFSTQSVFLVTVFIFVARRSHIINHFFYKPQWKYQNLSQLELYLYWACSELSSYKNAYIILLGQFEEKDHLVNVGVGGRIILKLDLKKMYEDALD